jgi:hypothetical protein
VWDSEGRLLGLHRADMGNGHNGFLPFIREKLESVEPPRTQEKLSQAGVPLTYVQALNLSGSVL